MHEPIKASEVEKVDERTEDEKRQQEQRRFVQGILARQSAIRKAGGVPPAGSAGNIPTLEERLRARDRANYDRFRKLR
jgi:hypothetical protein